MVMALTIAVLMAGSVYLIMQRGMVRIIFGMSLFGHASNLTLLGLIRHMTEVERWGVLTIGTGLGNARFTNRKARSED